VTERFTVVFNLSNWWHRKRSRAQVRVSSRPVRVHRLINPYHAVSIKAGPSCHQTAQKYGSQRFLSSEAPSLPQPTCAVAACECRYLHHKDRRDGFDRRHRDAGRPNFRLTSEGERRRSHGRRAMDH
jgi:hypothetical protein